MLVSEIIALVIILFLIVYPICFFAVESSPISTVVRVFVAVIIISVVVSLGVFQHKINAKRLIKLEKCTKFWREQLTLIEDEDMEKSYREVLSEFENKTKDLKRKFSEKDFVEYTALKILDSKN